MWSVSANYSNKNNNYNNDSSAARADRPEQWTRTTRIEEKWREENNNSNDINRRNWNKCCHAADAYCDSDSDVDFGSSRAVVVLPKWLTGSGQWKILSRFDTLQQAKKEKKLERNELWTANGFEFLWGIFIKLRIHTIHWYTSIFIFSQNHFHSRFPGMIL